MTTIDLPIPSFDQVITPATVKDFHMQIAEVNMPVIAATNLEMMHIIKDRTTEHILPTAIRLKKERGGKDAERPLSVTGISIQPNSAVKKELFLLDPSLKKQEHLRYLTEDQARANLEVRWYLHLKVEQSARAGRYYKEYHRER